MSQKLLNHARTLLDQLKALDMQTTGAYYEMGRRLSAIEHGGLYEALGYPSFAALIEEELSFTTSTGYRYLHMYRHLKRLHYTKTEALAMLNEYGFTHLVEYLPTAKQKVGNRAIKARIAEIADRSRQINFTLTPEQHQRTLTVLQKLGCRPSEAGRLINSSDAFMRLVESHDTVPTKEWEPLKTAHRLKLVNKA